MRRILYCCPDVQFPSGGIKCLYRHVAQLNRLGVSAFIVHNQRSFKLLWHGYDVPMLCVQGGLELTKDDVLVVPESLIQFANLAKGQGCKRVLLPLSWTYVYQSLPDGMNWRSYGIDHVITPSPTIKRFIEWSMGLEVTLIDDFIDTSKFKHRPELKRNKIAYIVRKSTVGDTLAKIFKSRGGISNSYEWLGLFDVPESQYTAQLIESRIYLATGTQEGANVSVLEAMSAGCIVLGFSGVGGRDFMCGAGPQQNCILVENNDLPMLAKAVEAVISNFAASPHAFDQLIQNATDTAARYGDPDREGRCLKQYFDSL